MFFYHCLMDFKINFIVNTIFLKLFFPSPGTVVKSRVISLLHRSPPLKCSRATTTIGNAKYCETAVRYKLTALFLFFLSRPLHEAVENGDVHLVRLLLGYGADPRLATYSGQSPLSLATDRQTRMLLEHHVNDVQGFGPSAMWNFDDTSLIRDHEDVDRLLWCSPPTAPDDNSVSFEFEFSDQSLPDVYKMPADAPDAVPDDWVLFEYVSTALSVESVDALAKLLDDENAVIAVPSDRFNERVVPALTLGQRQQQQQQQRVVAKCSDAKPFVAAEQSTPKDAAATDAAEAPEAAEDGAPAAGAAPTGDQIILVRYDHKLKQLLGVDAYTVS
ncbi:Ankyrin repeat-containing domain,Ankyrin repeat [Cinara cedri]|uniref:Ankyrin repeat-containing domain,Ankyrin repeat n=1 Tax=Cinara cedri TaxID=506608 RepID=A0A5E4NMM0_9HEMI|nr:Ankyrin repeat-containing domain,Ankyrin repeat [Cinara cedri]